MFGYCDQAVDPRVVTDPAIVRDPRRPAAHGTVVRAFTENVDILPTLCDAAKRYLVAVEPGYTLSAVSGETLLAQGGPMRPAEPQAFERSAVFADAVALRRADDAAKIPGRAVPALDAWLPLVGSCHHR